MLSDLLLENPRSQMSHTNSSPLIFSVLRDTSFVRRSLDRWPRSSSTLLARVFRSTYFVATSDWLRSVLLLRMRRSLIGFDADSCAESSRFNLTTAYFRIKRLWSTFCAAELSTGELITLVLAVVVVVVIVAVEIVTWPVTSFEANVARWTVTESLGRALVFSVMGGFGCVAQAAPAATWAADSAFVFSDAITGGEFRSIGLICSLVAASTLLTGFLYFFRRLLYFFIASAAEASAVATFFSMFSIFAAYWRSKLCLCLSYLVWTCTVMISSICLNTDANWACSCRSLMRMVVDCLGKTHCCAWGYGHPVYLKLFDIRLTASFYSTNWLLICLTSVALFSINISVSCDFQPSSLSISNNEGRTICQSTVVCGSNNEELICYQFNKRNISTLSIRAGTQMIWYSILYKHINTFTSKTSAHSRNR